MQHWLGVLAMGAIALGIGCGDEASGGPPEATGGGGAPAAMPGPTTTTGSTTVLGPGVTPGPTFADVYQTVLEPHGCVTSYCHDLAVGPPALGALHNAYTHFVGVVSPEQGCGGMTLVVPGDPEQSLLFLKVSMAKPPCGNQMPNLGTPLVPAQVELIRAWIEGGAPE